MVMVSACGEESSRVSEPLTNLETENTVIKVESTVEIRDLQMDVANPYAWVNGRVVHGILDDKDLSKTIWQANTFVSTANDCIFRVKVRILFIFFEDQYCGLVEYACPHHGIYPGPDP